MSVFVLDASYALPWVWQLEVSKVLAQAVVKGKVPLVSGIPLAINNHDLQFAAEACGITVLTPSVRPALHHRSSSR